jgi:hypothetical protein
VYIVAIATFAAAIVVVIVAVVVTTIAVPVVVVDIDIVTAIVSIVVILDAGVNADLFPVIMYIVAITATVACYWW